MNYVPLRVSMAIALSAPNSQPEASNSQASTQATAATSTAPTAPVYSTPKPAPQLCREDLHLDTQKDGIRLLDMVCHQISLLHNLMHSLMHRLLSRWLLNLVHRLPSRWVPSRTCWQHSRLHTIHGVCRWLHNSTDRHHRR